MTTTAPDNTKTRVRAIREAQRVEICSARHSVHAFDGWGDGSPSVEASEIKHDGLLHDRVWNDRPDVGFVLLNIHRGTRAIFLLQTTERDADGGVTACRYAPTSGAIAEHPALRDVVLTVWND